MNANAAAVERSWVLLAREVGQGAVVAALSASTVGALLGILSIATRALGSV